MIEDVKGILKSTETLFRVVELVLEKGYVIDATSKLEEMYEQSTRIILFLKVREENVEIYKETVGNCLYRIMKICERENILNESFITLVKRYSELVMNGE